MTDRPPDGRIDLGAFDADRVREDRVITATLARIAADPIRDAGETIPTRYIRLAIAAAAVLVVAAVGTVIVTDGSVADDGQPVAILASWAEAQHVPTNAELLAAFQGYGGGR